MSTIYVLNKDGKPLMPTTRGGHVRHLLKEQKARVVRTKPFTNCIVGRYRMSPGMKQSSTAWIK